MKLTFCFLEAAFLLELFLVLPAAGENAGIAARINEKGIKEVSQVAKEIVLNKYKRFKIRYLKSKNYQLRNLQILDLNLGDVSITTAAPNSVTLHVKDASVKVSSGWTAYITIFWGRSKFFGHVIADADGINLSQEVLLGMNSNGAPRITPGDCSFSIRTLKLHVSHVGWLSWLVVPVVNSLTPFIKSKIENMACPGIKREALKYFELGESKYPLNVPIKDILIPFKNININIALTEPPEVTNSSISLYITGRCYNRIINPTQRYTFLAPALPAFPQSQEMAQGLLSQYVLNTLLISLWDNYYRSSVDFTEEQIDRFFKVNVSSEALAKELPEFKNYPNQPLQFSISNPEPFHVEINSSGITLLGPVNMKINVELPNNVIKTVVDVRFTIEGTGTLIISNNVFYAQLINLNVYTTDDEKAAQYFVQLFRQNKARIINLLNEKARMKSLHFEIFYGFQITHPIVQLLEKTIAVSGSISKV